MIPELIQYAATHYLHSVIGALAEDLKLQCTVPKDIEEVISSDEDIVFPRLKNDPDISIWPGRPFCEVQTSCPYWSMCFARSSARA